MAKVDFANVDTLVVDPDRASLDAVRMILRNNGFKIVRQGSTRAEVEAAFKARMPDLLISDSDLGGNAFEDMVHRLRHYELGGNPFLPIIAMTREPTPDLVRKVIGCGSDDLVPKPISIGHLMKRIEILIEARKPFVVTSEYIGPDRRNSKDRPSDIPLLQVPNSLRTKATGESNPEIDAQAIAAAIDEINIQKLERYAIQIAYLVEHLVPPLEKGTYDKATEELVARLVYVSEDTARRMVGTKYMHVSDLCQSMIKVARDVLGAKGKPAPKDVKLLTPLAQAINQGFDSAEATAKAARQISTSIGR